MEIYRVTYEYPFSGDVFDSRWFSNEADAMKYARQSAKELEEVAEHSSEIVVAAYTDDADGEFMYHHGIETFRL